MSYTPAEDRYDRMPYRRCGRSGLLLPAVSLGAWQTFGGYKDEEIARQCIHRAFDLGITHFDFANNYGTPPGNAELVCGRILRAVPRDELILSSKAGYRMWPGPYGEWGSRKYLIASCDQSLQRMGVEYFDVFYSHRPDPHTPLEETLGALDTLVKQGKALYAGVSSYSGAQFADSVRVVQQHDWAPITIHQPYYNMLNRTIEWDLLPQTERFVTGVIAFAPLASGLLRTMKWSGTQLEEVLNRQSGLLGLSGRSSDVRELEQAAAAGDTRANLALAMFAYRVRKYIGAYVAALGSVDAIIFSGGVGQHSAPMRRQIAGQLECLGAMLDANRNLRASPDQASAVHSTISRVQLWVIPTDEERQIASEAFRLLK